MLLQRYVLARPILLAGNPLPPSSPALSLICLAKLSVTSRAHSNRAGHLLCRSLCVCVHARSCLTLCNPMDCSPAGSSVHGILQRRIVEQVPFPSPGDLPDPGIEPTSPALAGEFFLSLSHLEMLSFKDCKARLLFSCVLAQYLMQHGGSLI